MLFKFKCSEDQRFMIEEHLFRGRRLEFLPSERIMIYETCKNRYPNCKILGANLNLETIEWEITLEDSKHEQKEQT